MISVTSQKIKIFSVGLLVAVRMFSISLANPQASPFKVLAFYTPYAQMGDAAHAAYALEANTWFPMVASANGFTYETSTNFGDLNATKLAEYKVIMFLDNYPGDASQRSAFQTYVTNGGGFIGCHVSAFNQNPSAWDWYFNQFLAMGSYKNNTWAPTTAILTVEDTSFGITKGFPKVFTGPVNEWYAWMNDLRQNSNIKVLCSINAASYPLGTGTGSGGASEIWQNNGEYRPIIWTNKNYRMMYTNIGHDDVNYSTRVGLTKTFSDTQYVRLMLNAIKYCAGLTTSIEGGESVVKQSNMQASDMSLTYDSKFVTISLTNGGRFSTTLTDLKGRVLGSAIESSGVCRIAKPRNASGTLLVQVKFQEGVRSQRLVIEK